MDPFAQLRIERSLGVADVVISPEVRREAAAATVLESWSRTNGQPEEGRKNLYLGVAEGCVSALVRAHSGGETDRLLAALENPDETARRIAATVTSDDVRPPTAERTNGPGVSVEDVPMEVLEALMRELVLKLAVYVHQHPADPTAKVWLDVIGGPRAVPGAP